MFLRSSIPRVSRMALISGCVALGAVPAIAGDAAQGKAVFAAQCAICHSAAKGGPSIVGPGLYGVVGRKAGTVTGFAYSPGMKAAGWTWTNDKLEAFLPAPSAMVTGTRMTYAGLKDATKRADLIAYLGSLK